MIITTETSSTTIIEIWYVVHHFHLQVIDVMIYKGQQNTTPIMESYIVEI